MVESPPASVILPTVRWTDACGEVAGQLVGDDELLVVCDVPSDPVAGRRGDLPAGVDVVVAGEPTRCSGKANAIVAGMEAASHDRLVWTDDDFHHPEAWLATLKADYERQGPTTEAPVFVGRDPLATLLEPGYVVSTTLAATGQIAWGGALVFDRADVDETELVGDLAQTVSDDGTLADHLAFEGVRRTRRVPVGGSIRESLERHARFMQITRRHSGPGWFVSTALIAIVTVLLVLHPLVGFLAVTGAFAATYVALGIRRWTVVLAYPMFLAWLPLLAYALARRTFVWSGRRYHWRSMFDVEVTDA